MKKLISLLIAMLLIVSACAFAATGSITVDDVTVPDVSFPSENADTGSSIISSTQTGSTGKNSVQAEEDEEEEESAAGMLGMADVLSALKGDEVTAYEAVEKTAADASAAMEGFGLTLHVLEPEMPVYAVLQEIAAFVAEAPVNEYMGDEFTAAAADLLPEGCDPSALALDELYELTVSGYDPAWGDIESAFEFVTEYEEDIVLLAAAGILPAAEGVDQETLWLPMQARVSEGRVCIQLTQQVLETANAGESTIAFALLQLEAPAEAN